MSTTLTLEDLVNCSEEDFPQLVADFTQQHAGLFGATMRNFRVKPSQLEDATAELALMTLEWVIDLRSGKTKMPTTAWTRFWVGRARNRLRSFLDKQNATASGYGGYHRRQRYLWARRAELEARLRRERDCCTGR